MGVVMVHVREQLQARGVEIDEDTEQDIVRLLDPSD